MRKNSVPSATIPSGCVKGGLLRPKRINIKYVLYLIRHTQILGFCCLDSDLPSASAEKVFYLLISHLKFHPRYVFLLASKLKRSLALLREAHLFLIKNMGKLYLILNCILNPQAPCSWGPAPPRSCTQAHLAIATAA